MERPHESVRSREIPIEILHDILVRLPTRAVVRSSCVSKLWRKLHDAYHVAAASESEALLVSEYRVPGRRDEVSVFNLSSGKAMCHVAIPSRYSLIFFSTMGKARISLLESNEITTRFKNLQEQSLNLSPTQYQNLKKKDLLP
ncbi:unnamed protein product [Urochloa humidicola]